MAEERTPRRRFQAKNRSNTAPERKLRWTWVLAGFSLIIAAVATYVGLRSPMFDVDTVRVAGVDTLDGAALAEISGLQGESMFRLNLEEATANLQALPQVKSVTFERDWPKSVTINIVERVPYAFWSVGGREYTVDADGIVLAVGSPSGPAPRIIEPDANRIMGPGDQVHPDALALAARISFESPKILGQSVDILEYRPGIGVTAVFSSGMRVTFGDERSYEYKVAVLSNLLLDLQARGVAQPRAVDLRFGERVTYE